MHIDIHGPPPENIPLVRRKFTHLTIFFLVLVFCSIILGVIGILYKTGYDDLVHNTAFVLFIGTGLCFVYFSEKLLKYRRLGPGQQKEVQALARENEKVNEYCRKVAEQGRYLVVEEYEAIVAHMETLKKGAKSA